MKHKVLLFIISLFAATAATAQVDGFGLRTSLLPWAVGSPSVGADITWNGRYLFAADGNFGDWKVDRGDRRFRHSSVGIEARRYFSDGTPCWASPNGGVYKGMYLGIDGRHHWINNSITTIVREGIFITAGLVVGYSFHTRGNWSVDAGIGCGYVYKDYNKYILYPPAGMDRLMGVVKGSGFGLTSLSVSLVYRFGRR